MSSTRGLTILALTCAWALSACGSKDERQADSAVEHGIARSVADVEAARQAMAGGAADPDVQPAAAG